jgi:hypothetical protein
VFNPFLAKERLLKQQKDKNQSLTMKLIEEKENEQK